MNDTSEAKQRRFEIGLSFIGEDAKKCLLLKKDNAGDHPKPQLPNPKPETPKPNSSTQNPKQTQSPTDPVAAVFHGDYHTSIPFQDGGEVGMGKMERAGLSNHMGGIPRRIVFMAVGTFAKAVASFFNTTSVQNADTLIHLVRSRPLNTPLITISNHMSTLDDPFIWGFKGFPSMDAKLARWVLAAEDICFKSALLSYFFRLGKCIPITRGAGIYQEHMNEALERLSDGAWLHTFPEGKVSQEDSPIRRLKWGTASLIVRAPVTPIILPIVHHGLQEVMPENFVFGKRPPFPLCNKKVKILVGEPIEFDLPKLKQEAVSTSRNLSFPKVGWPTSPCGLDEAAQRCLFTSISEQIWAVMERLRNSLKHS